MNYVHLVLANARTIFLLRSSDYLTEPELILHPSPDEVLNEYLTSPSLTVIRRLHFCTEAETR